jgi:NAD-dependent DNA ligase
MIGTAQHSQQWMIDKQRGWDLFALITKHRFFYHVISNAMIADEEYDTLVHKIRQIHERTPIPELISVIDTPSKKRIKDYPLYYDYLQEMRESI